MRQSLGPSLQHICSLQHTPICSSACRHQRCWLGVPRLRKLRDTSACANVSDKRVQAVPEQSQKGSEPHGQSAVGPDQFDAQGLLEELKDETDLGKRGEGWTIAQLAAVPIILFPPFHLEKLATALGVLMVIGGLYAMFLGQQNLGKSLSPLPKPRKASKFVSNGIYEYVRHPMYGGLILVSLGVAAVTHDETRLLLALGLWLVLEKKIALEEKFLVDRYGAAYEAYKATVMKLFPYIY
eukprot:GHUV01006413.1.p1 GENE.GHUV01006413.1~~GHUV01006413.1.p1  ORF type:complete len:239 (+),score=54.08 GHUV01006413.1:345-1061(+)